MVSNSMGREEAERRGGEDGEKRKEKRRTRKGQGEKKGKEGKERERDLPDQCQTASYAPVESYYVLHMDAVSGEAAEVVLSLEASILNYRHGCRKLLRTSYGRFVQRSSGGGTVPRGQYSQLQARL